jgi:hypothetical protein
MNSNSYVYFLYSSSYVADRNNIENKVGKRFIPGNVIVNGVRKEYSMISESATINRYSDIRVVAEGILSEMKYTNTSTGPRRV